MNNDFYEYVAKRCNEALLNDDEYLKLERGDFPEEEQLARAVYVCYVKALKDCEEFKGSLENISR